MTAVSVECETGNRLPSISELKFSGISSASSPVVWAGRTLSAGSEAAFLLFGTGDRNLGGVGVEVDDCASVDVDRLMNTFPTAAPGHVLPVRRH